MIVRGDKCLAAPSLAHTVGNVTFKFTKFLKEMFGNHYYKNVHLDTRMAYTEFAINTNKEFFHKNKPLLAIKPVIDITNEDIFLTHSLMTTNMYGQSMQGGTSFNFNPFFRDIKRGNGIGYMLDRIRVVFGVTIQVDTVIEQMNIFNTLNALYVQERPYYMRTAIEIQIPHQFMQMVSIDSGVPIYDESGSVEKFLKFINSNTCKPVTFQMKNSTGHEEFFMYYPLNIEYTFADFNIGDVDKKGFASNGCDITFSITTEFNTASLFEYIPANGSNVIKNEDIQVEADFTKQQMMVPIFTYADMFTATNKEGWKFFTSRMYKVEENVLEDKFDISQIFESTNIKDIVEYHNQNGIDNKIFFDLKVLMIDKYLEEGTDFQFDFKTLTLITKRMNKYVTYRFVIYINNEYVNDLMVRLNPKAFNYK